MYRRALPPLHPYNAADGWYNSHWYEAGSEPVLTAQLRHPRSSGSDLQNRREFHLRIQVPAQDCKSPPHSRTQQADSPETVHCAYRRAESASVFHAEAIPRQYGDGIPHRSAHQRVQKTYRHRWLPSSASFSVSDGQSGDRPAGA